MMFILLLLGLLSSLPLLLSPYNTNDVHLTLTRMELLPNLLSQEKPLSVHLTLLRTVINTPPPPPPPLPLSLLLLLFVSCLTSQQHTSVSQGQICSDKFMCCHTERQVAHQTCYLIQSHHTDTGPTSPSADLVTLGTWQSSHWTANFLVTGITPPRKNPNGASRNRTPDLPLSRWTPQPLASEAVQQNLLLLPPPPQPSLPVHDSLSRSMGRSAVDTMAPASSVMTGTALRRPVRPVLMKSSSLPSSAGLRRP